MSDNDALVKTLTRLELTLEALLKRVEVWETSLERVMKTLHGYEDKRGLAEFIRSNHAEIEAIKHEMENARQRERKIIGAIAMTVLSLVGRIVYGLLFD